MRTRVLRGLPQFHSPRSVDKPPESWRFRPAIRSRFIEPIGCKKRFQTAVMQLQQMLQPAKMPHFTIRCYHFFFRFSVSPMQHLLRSPASPIVF
jgi:hypothetical protein